MAACDGNVSVLTSSGTILLTPGGRSKGSLPLPWGESLEEARAGVERLEHAARILFLAEQVGGLRDLPVAELESLRERRRALGLRIL